MTLHAALVQPFIEFGFMRRALVACLALAFSCGPVGTLLVLRRMSLVGDAMAHALLPGAALGFIVAGLSLSAMSIGAFLAARLAWSAHDPRRPQLRAHLAQQAKSHANGFRLDIARRSAVMIWRM